MQIITFDSLESTNTFLKENHNDYKSHTIIRALKQTKGRGRFDRVWQSGADLTFSILFKDVNANHHLIAPLAILKALEHFNIKSLIKWPNDVYIDGKKVSGVLVESIYSQNEKLCDIVGIGINLTKKPNELNATYVDIDAVLLLNEVAKAYTELLNVGNQFLLKLYQTHSYVIGKKVLYKNKAYEIMSFTEDLKLILSDREHTIIVSANEIDIKTSILK